MTVSGKTLCLLFAAATASQASQVKSAGKSDQENSLFEVGAKGDLENTSTFDPQNFMEHTMEPDLESPAPDHMLDLSNHTSLSQGTKSAWTKWFQRPQLWFKKWTDRYSHVVSVADSNWKWSGRCYATDLAIIGNCMQFKVQESNVQKLNAHGQVCTWKF